MQKPTPGLLKSLTPGTRVQILDFEEEAFEGLVKRVDSGTIYVEQCCKVGGSKVLPGIQQFVHSNVGGIAVICAQEGTVSAEETCSSVQQHLVKEPKRNVNAPLTKKKFNNFNPHLFRLYPPEMDEILKQKQIVPPPVLGCLPLEKFQPRSLPIPCQEVTHMSGERFKDRSLVQFKVIREQTWLDPNSPPPLKYCPKKLYLIANRTEFEFATGELNRQSILGLSVQGQRVSRLGQLSVVLMSTRESVFLFDVVSLGEMMCLGSESPMKRLLENPSIMKVVHDCRPLSDILYNKFNVTLANVYDTLAAHTVFATWAIYHGFMPRYATPLSELVRGYLGVKVQFNHFPHKRAYAIEEDTSIWMKRPMEPHMEMNAVYDVMYLLDLQKATREAMNRPFVNMTECLLADVRDVSDLDCSVKLSNVHQLPLNCRRILPNWKPNEFGASRMGMIEPPFVHQTMCQIDPMINFSRDVIHQKRPPGSDKQSNLNF